MKKRFFAFVIAALGIVLSTSFGSLPRGKAPDLSPEQANNRTSESYKIAFTPLDGFFEFENSDHAHYSTGDAIDTSVDPIRGFGPSLAERLQTYANVSFSYVYCETFDSIKTLVLGDSSKGTEGDPALIRMPGTTTDKASSVYSYTNVPLFTTYYAIMALQNSKDIYYQDFETIVKKKVGIIASAYQDEEVKSYLADMYANYANGDASNLIATYSSFEEMKSDLVSGKIDCLISNDMDLSDDTKILARFRPIEAYASMKKSVPNGEGGTIENPYFKSFDKTLSAFGMDEPSALGNLYEDFFSNRTISSFTREEVNYVAESNSTGPIIVGEMIRSPLAYLDGDKISGLFPAILDEAVSSSGLNVTHEALANGVRGVDWLQSDSPKKRRIVNGMMYSEISSPSATLTSTNDCLTTSIVVVARNDIGTFDPKNITSIAIHSGYINGAEILAKTYPNATIDGSYATPRDSFLAVQDGKAQITVQNIYVAQEILLNPRFGKLVILPAYSIKQTVRFAMAPDEDSLLVSILNKGIAAISSTRMDEIITQYSIGKNVSISASDYMYAYKNEIIIFTVLSLSPITILVALIIIVSHSRRKLNEKNIQLSEAYQEAQAAAEAKGSFLARMSHEIRTPMNAMMGLTEMALDHTDDPAQVRDDLQKAVISGETLLGVVNNVLDMSSIERGKIKIDHSPFDFKALISNLTGVFLSECENKNIDFEVDFLTALPETLVGDSLRLNQILMNLLSNAVKFTDKGKVSLNIGENLSRGNEVFIEFAVKDTGIGMSEEMKARLFKPFEQETAKTAQIHGGSGLGLSIVQNIVGLLRGKIKAESTLGEGSIFTVTLPFEMDPKAPLEQKSTDLANLRVLLVEVEREIAYAEGILQRIGVKYIVASSGGEALKIFRSSNKKEGPFDVVISGSQLSDMRGSDFTKTIRKEYGTKPLIIVIAGYDDGKSREEAMKAGATEFVAKPIFQSTLFDALMSLAEPYVKAEEKPNPKWDFSSKRILLAEDNEINRLVAVSFLKKAGFALVDTAGEGVEALKKFEESELGYYSIVALDIQMPKMNGYDVAKKIRSLARGDAKSVPLVAMTANAFDEDVSESLQAGMNGHISKPIEFDKMCEALWRALAEGK